MMHDLGTKLLKSCYLIICLRNVKGYALLPLTTNTSVLSLPYYLIEFKFLRSLILLAETKVDEPTTRTTFLIQMMKNAQVIMLADQNKYGTEHVWLVYRHNMYNWYKWTHWGNQ